MVNKAKKKANNPPPQALASTPRRRRRNRNANGGVPRELVSRVCGIVDPFCDHAMGAKYPDDSSTRTLPYTMRTLAYLSTDANGDGGFILLPQYSYNPYTNMATGTLPNVTTWGNFNTSGAPGIAGVDSYRIVSIGVKLRNIVAPLSSSGIVSLRTFPHTSGANLEPLNYTTYNCSQSGNVALQHCKEYTIVVPHTAQMPQVFYKTADDSASVAGWNAKGFEPVTIYVSGAAASTNVLAIETVIHYELTFDDSSGLQQAATPPPPANAVITTTANRVTSELSAFAGEGVIALGKAVVTKVVTGLGRKIIGPVGALALT